MESIPSFIHFYSINDISKKFVIEVIKIDNIIIAYNINKDNIYYFNDRIINLVYYIDILKISVFTIDDDITDIDRKITNYINDNCFNKYYELTNNFQINPSVIFNNMIMKKIFSKFLPYIPLLKITIINELNSKLILYNDKIIGYLIDSTIVIPLNFILNVISSYIKNNGLYILPNLLSYKTCTINNNNDEEEYYMIIKEKYKL